MLPAVKNTCNLKYEYVLFISGITSGHNNTAEFNNYGTADTTVLYNGSCRGKLWLDCGLAVPN